MATKSKLTPQQRLFTHEYLIDLNGKQAAIRAGYSAKTAEVKGSQLLRLVKVKRVIDAAIEKRTKKIDISAEKVLNEIAEIAFIKLEIEGLYDPGHKLKALDQLGKHLKLFTDKIDLSGDINLTGFNIKFVDAEDGREK